MICYQCNESIPDGSRFCKKCGRKLASEAETSSGNHFRMAGDLFWECSETEPAVTIPKDPQQASEWLSQLKRHRYTREKRYK